MGTSTDAILAFGIDLGEEYSERGDLSRVDEEFDGDIDDFLDHLLGIHPYKHPQRQSYDEIDRIRAACPVEFIRHCHHEYVMIFLAVNGTQQRASRGDPVEVNMNLADGRVEAFLEWCRQHNINVDESEPKWQIFSMWS